jgi:hypothetical protein
MPVELVVAPEAELDMAPKHVAFQMADFAAK